MKLHVINPLAMLGALNGYNRPLDRHDWDGKGGHVPSWAGEFAADPGGVRRFANLTNMANGGVGIDSFGWGSAQLHPLGTLAVTKDGRVFRYAQAGAADLVAGNVVQTAAPIPLHLALTSAAEAIGAGGALDPITVTPGATAGAANLYAEGILTVDTTPSNGYNHRISGHPAITASVAFNLYLDPDDLVQVAFTTATRYGLHHNPYKNVIQTPTTATALVVGIAPAPITATQYGWLQTRGPAAVLINGTPAVTSPVANSGTTAGAVDVWTTAAAAVVVTPVGRMMQVGVSGKNNTVFVTLD